MIPIEYELDRLKEIIFEMFDLVKSQITESRDAVLKADIDLTESIIRRELRVNALEITVDRECENLLACYAPVAADLRFVISALKISGNLERISDHAYRIAIYIQEGDIKKDEYLVDKLNLKELFDTVCNMIDLSAEALDKQDAVIAKKTLKLDKTIDKAKKSSPEIIKKVVKEDNNHIKNALHFFSIIGKLERCGDLIKNISEEIVFYIEAEILKHKKRNKKIRKRIDKNDKTQETA